MSPDRIARRHFLRTLGCGALCSGAAQAAEPQILRAELGKPIRELTSHGDTWTTTWADDDCLYSVSDDTLGFNQASSSNLAVHRITGTPPNLEGKTINPMKQFGGWAEKSKEDGATWKASGFTSVDRVLYLAVSRHPGPFAKPYQIQQSWDSSIIKSTDHGQTWSATPRLGNAMFPGRLFANPFFVQYGKDGQGTKDGADQYVYAISNDGAWNNGNFMLLGRARRDRIGGLDPQDWEFVHGLGADSKPIWRPRHDNAWYVFRNPDRTSMAGVNYIAPLDLYIMPQWYYTQPPLSPRRWRATCFELFQAPAPWGPWTLFHTQYFEPEGYYNPSIASKFTSADGRRLWMFAAGYFLGSRTPEYYGLNMIPVSIKLPSDK